MTTTQTSRAALEHACRQIGLDTSNATLLKHHASAVYLLGSTNIVARVSFDVDDRKRARNSITLTQWLVAQEFPATAPADVREQPIDIDGGATVTFWQYYPQDDRQGPGAEYLGAMVRQLHDLPKPPVELQPYQPLQSLGHVIEHSETLSSETRLWLSQRRREIVEQYAMLDSDIGYGFCHGDAYPGNTLWGPSGPLLGDWDEIAHGPRELDLVNTYQGVRFGRSATELNDFTKAYGYDVTEWAGFATLREMRDLHTLASYIKLTDAGHEGARAELEHRIRTLQAGDADARWNAR